MFLFCFYRFRYEILRSRYAYIYIHTHRHGVRTNSPQNGWMINYQFRYRIMFTSSHCSNLLVKHKRAFQHQREQREKRNEKNAHVFRRVFERIWMRKEREKDSPAIHLNIFNVLFLCESRSSDMTHIRVMHTHAHNQTVTHTHANPCARIIPAAFVKPRTVWRRWRQHRLWHMHTAFNSPMNRYIFDTRAEKNEKRTFTFRFHWGNKQYTRFLCDLLLSLFPIFFLVSVLTSLLNIITTIINCCCCCCYLAQYIYIAWGEYCDPDYTWCECVFHLSECNIRIPSISGAIHFKSKSVKS